MRVLVYVEGDSDRTALAKAADHLVECPEDWVFALPDLYPMARYQGTVNAHGSFAELALLLRTRFEARANKAGLALVSREHFRVHCLKHDLEALLLAAPEALRKRLGTKDQLTSQWRKPVEEQNDEKPPKRIVEELFDRYGKKRKYKDTVDAASILSLASLDEIVAACPQQFAPFVRDLRLLADGRDLP